jgi:hypothetical protein
MLEVERGSTRSYCVQNLLWKSLWTCHNTDCGMNGINTAINLFNGSHPVVFNFIEVYIPSITQQIIVSK